MRDFERDIIPMCEAEGMALAPWGSLGRGAFMSPEDYERKEDGRKYGQSEEVKAICGALDRIAKAKGTLITSVAMAYVRCKSPYVFPIIGGRKIEHLKSNIEALGVELSDEEVDEIDGAVSFEHGFPLNFIYEFGGGPKYNWRMGPSDIHYMKAAGGLDTVTKSKPPKPRKE